MPKRVQMSRQHPWRAEHPDAVIVDRRTKWGNPVEGPWSGPGTLASAYRRLVVDRVYAFRRWTADDEWESPQTVAWHAEDHDTPTVAEIRRELAGKDLACWCKLSDPCHADVLLELANRGGR